MPKPALKKPNSFHLKPRRRIDTLRIFFGGIFPNIEKCSKNGIEEASRSSNSFHMKPKGRIDTLRIFFGWHISKHRKMLQKRHRRSLQELKLFPFEWQGRNCALGDFCLLILKNMENAPRKRHQHRLLELKFFPLEPQRKNWHHEYLEKKSPSGMNIASRTQNPSIWKERKNGTAAHLLDPMKMIRKTREILNDSALLGLIVQKKRNWWSLCSWVWCLYWHCCISLHSN